MREAGHEKVRAYTVVTIADDAKHAHSGGPLLELVEPVGQRGLRDHDEVRTINLSNLLKNKVRRGWGARRTDLKIAEEGASLQRLT